MPGAELQYEGTVLSGSPSNMTLTVGKFETVSCVPPTRPVPITSFEWYNPQGQLVSKDSSAVVRQAAAGESAYLIFDGYQQSQGGKYECRGNVCSLDKLEKFPVCIGECYTLGHH